MPNTPMVSIVMPSYNCETFLEQAVRSVLAQTEQNWELLILDDASEDGTRAVAERLAGEDERIRLICNEQNMGVARTRNRGFELCRGEFTALLDSDDVWHPEKLERQLALLRRSGAALCYCAYEIIDENGQPVRAPYTVPEQVGFEDLLKENVISCSTVVLRRDISQAYRFDPGYYHEDYVLWLRLLKDGHRAVGCPETLAAWRLNPGSRSFNKLKSAQNRWKIYRNHLKLPFFKSLSAFAAYAVAGFRKYRQ